MEHFDLVTIGGGMAGASLAKGMAERGARVLVIEREEEFRDRVRGETLPPWGVAEAEALGLRDSLLDEASAIDCRLARITFGDSVIERDLPVTTPQGTGFLTFFHPALERTFLAAAKNAGATIRRAARVVDIRPGSPPSIAVVDRGRTYEISARLVVGADGRNGITRSKAGFESRRDEPRLLISGVLVAVDAQAFVRQTFDLYPGPAGRMALAVPVNAERFRLYVVCHRDVASRRLSGHGDFAAFVEHACLAGMARDRLSAARAVGLLATFDGADSWVDHPYRDGVVLVGDAAATSDPSWGQGMPLTLRDVRVLRDLLLQNDNWDAAAHAYAEEHDRYYEIVHRTERWFTDLLLDTTDAGQTRRQRAIPHLINDPTRICDVGFSGPESPCDEGVRVRHFCEDLIAA